MPNKKQISVLLIFTFFLISVSSGQILIQKGKADMSRYNFEKNNPVELKGVWEFYPSKLYKPSDFKKGSPEIPKYVTIPSLWTKDIFPNSKSPNIGYGTYHVHLKISDSTHIFALRLKRIETAYKIWINNKKILETGKIGKGAKTSIPEQKTITTTFSTDKPYLDIIIQVSNFQHRKGGIDSPVILGSAEKVYMQTKKSRGYEVFIIGVLLIMAVFHLGLFAVRKKDFSLLFFALLLITEIISMSTNGETLLTYYFPNTDWLLMKRIDYISNFARISFFILFFRHTYTEYINKYFTWSVVGINILSAVYVLFTNLQVFAFTLFIFIAATAVSLIYVLYAQIKAIFDKKEGSLIPLTGTLILLLTAVNDVLYVAGLYNSIFLVPLGLFVFIFAQSYLLSFNFSKLYKQEEELNSLISDVENIKNELLNNTNFSIYVSLNILCKNMHSDRGFLFILNEASEPVFKANFPEMPYNKYENPFPQNIISKVIESKQKYIINRTLGGLHIDKEYLNKYPVHSAMAVPFKVSGQVKAVAWLERHDKRHNFTDYDGKVLEEITDQIIGLIDNSDIFEETRNITQNLEKIIEARTKDVSNQRNLLETQKNEIESVSVQLTEKLHEIKEQNNIITENIKSAQLIQQTLIPDIKEIREQFRDFFVIFRPKEIVSGDFYHINKIINEKGETNTVFTLADCTGHGVPGVLMSLIGTDLINNTVINKKIYKPAHILNQIQQDISAKFSQSEENLKVKDGMDMAVINFNPDTYMLEYAGAKTDLLILRNGKLNEVKADRLSVSAGLHEKLKDKTFKNYQIQLKKDDILYLATDGYQDQFGGENDTKFMKKNFKALLEEIGSLQFNIQRSRLLKTLNHWQGKNIQNDDITVIGIKI